MVAAGVIPPGCRVRVNYCEESDALEIAPETDSENYRDGLCATPALARRVRRGEKSFRLTA